MEPGCSARTRDGVVGPMAAVHTVGHQDRAGAPEPAAAVDGHPLAARGCLVDRGSGPGELLRGRRGEVGQRDVGVPHTEGSQPDLIVGALVEVHQYRDALGAQGCERGVLAWTGAAQHLATKKSVAAIHPHAHARENQQQPLQQPRARVATIPDLLGREPARGPRVALTMAWRLRGRKCFGCRVSDGNTKAARAWARR